MRAALAAAGLMLVLVACGNKPPTPDWQMNAHDSAERAAQAWLVGDTRIEAVEFARARADVARTGRPDLLARLELSRCAWRVASLVFEDCSGFAALASDAGPAERAYAAYLAGTPLAPAEVALLPEQHRAAAAGGADAVARIEDPLARLVAAGAQLRRGAGSPAAIDAAITTASAQGWRRPLAAWLEVQAKRAADGGDSEAAARLRRRIGLVTGEGARPPAAPASTAAASDPRASRDAAWAAAFKTLRTLDCARCHGRDHEGPAAPSLVAFAATRTREEFAAAVLEGNAPRGMPPYRSNPLAVAAVGDLYAYFKARADHTIGADWRP